MAESLLHTDKEIAEIYERHIKTIYRICFAYMKIAADAEDVVQDAFVKLIRFNGVFQSIEHENLADYENLQSMPPFEIDETFHTVMDLPDKYKTVIYLYYYEGYTSVEISKMLHKPQSTVRNHLYEARNILRQKLGGDLEGTSVEWDTWEKSLRRIEELSPEIVILGHGNILFGKDTVLSEINRIKAIINDAMKMGMAPTKK